MLGGIIFISTLLRSSWCLNGRGLTPLDSASFDKITSKFKATLIKFDTYFPYGPVHDEFVKMATSTADISDFLVAEVGVKDYGDFENQDLLDRFKIPKEDIPVIKLYFPDGRPPVPFTGDVTEAALRRLVRSAGVSLPLPGALPQFDALAGRLTAAAGPTERAALLTEAERLLAEADDQQQVAARYYVRVMQTVAEQGGRFVESERTRLRGLLQGKLSDKKRKEVEARLNALAAFAAPGEERDEL